MFNEELENKLNELSEKLKLDYGKVKDTFNSALKRIQEEKKITDEKLMIEKAFIHTKNRLISIKERYGKDLTEFKGFLINISEEYDLALNLARKRLSAYNRNPQEAVLNGLVKVEEGNVIPIIRVKGKEVNLSKVKWLRRDYMFLVKEDTWKILLLTSNRELNLELYVPYSFNVRVKSRKGNTITANISSLTMFNKVNLDIQYLKALKEVFGEIKFKDIDMYLEKYIGFYADISVILTGLTKTGKRMIKVTDPQADVLTSLTLLYPVSMPLIFGEDERLFVVGRPFKIKNDLLVDVLTICPKRCM